MTLGEATSKGEQLGREVTDLKARLSQSQDAHDAAVDARDALSQQLHREFLAMRHEYERVVMEACKELDRKSTRLNSSHT